MGTTPGGNCNQTSVQEQVLLTSSLQSSSQPHFRSPVMEPEASTTPEGSSSETEFLLTWVLNPLLIGYMSSGKSFYQSYLFSR